MKVKTQIKLLRNCNVSIINGFGNQLAEVKVDEYGEIWAYENQSGYELHENDIIHHIEVRPDKHWQLYIYMTQEDVYREILDYIGVLKRLQLLG